MGDDRLAEVLARIAELQAKAEPLRALPEDDVMAGYALGKIVDEINALRREESTLRTGYMERPVPAGAMQPKHLAQLQELLDQGIDPRVPPGTSINQARATLHLPKRGG